MQIPRMGSNAERSRGTQPLVEVTAISNPHREGATALTTTTLFSFQGSQLAQPNQEREPIVTVHIGQPPGTES